MAKLVIEKKDPTFFPRFYNYALIDDYGNARGMNVVNVSRICIKDDIEVFVKERMESIALVRDLLNSKAIDYRDSNTIEYVNNREFIVSNNTDCDTTIVTPDQTVLKDIRRDRVILKRLGMLDNCPILLNDKDDKQKFKVINSLLYNTIMIINPSPYSIKVYERLFDNPYFNVIIGESGKTYERDIKEKMGIMYRLYYTYGNNGNDLSMINVKRQNNYACILASTNLRR